MVFFRNVLQGQDRGDSPMIEVNPIFEHVAREHGILSEGLMERIATDGTLAKVEGVPEEIRRVFVCANDVSPESGNYFEKAAGIAHRLVNEYEAHAHPRPRRMPAQQTPSGPSRTAHASGPW